MDDSWSSFLFNTKHRIHSRGMGMFICVGISISLGTISTSLTLIFILDFNMSTCQQNTKDKAGHASSASSSTTCPLLLQSDSMWRCRHSFPESILSLNFIFVFVSSDRSFYIVMMPLDWPRQTLFDMLSIYANKHRFFLVDNYISTLSLIDADWCQGTL